MTRRTPGTLAIDVFVRRQMNRHGILTMNLLHGGYIACGAGTWSEVLRRTKSARLYDMSTLRLRD